MIDGRCTSMDHGWMILDIPVLKSFVAVVETGGFTRAADRVHLTQSAVSLHVKRLEEATGKRLLERSSRSVGLTPDGELLLAYARRILQLHDEAGARLAAPDLDGAVRFGVPEYVRQAEVAGLIARFHRVHPRVRLDLVVGPSSDLLGRLAAGELDLAVAVDCSGDADAGEVLWREPRVWLASADASPEREDPLPLALFQPPCFTRTEVVAALDRAGVAWRIAATSPGSSALLSAAQAGIAVTALPESAAGPGLRVVGAREGLPPLPDYRFALFGLRADAPPSVRRFAEEVRAAFARRGAPAAVAA